MDDRILEGTRGGAVVTDGSRLARHLRGEYDAIQRTDGLFAWPVPPVDDGRTFAQGCS